jgi:hypothetical protein
MQKWWGEHAVNIYQQGATNMPQCKQTRLSTNRFVIHDFLRKFEIEKQNELIFKALINFKNRNPLCLQIIVDTTLPLTRNHDYAYRPEPHNFYAAPDPSKNFYADPALATPAPAPTLQFSKAKFLKETKV